MQLCIVLDRAYSSYSSYWKVPTVQCGTEPIQSIELCTAPIQSVQSFTDSTDDYEIAISQHLNNIGRLLFQVSADKLR